MVKFWLHCRLGAFVAPYFWVACGYRAGAEKANVGALCENVIAGGRESHGAIRPKREKAEAMATSASMCVNLGL